MDIVGEFSVNKFYNEDCFSTMKRMVDGNVLVDGIITSPPYNSNKKAGDNVMTEKNSSYVRYDVHIDNMTVSEYAEFTTKVFNNYNKILKENGVILYNLSYGSGNAENMLSAMASVINETPFTIVDIIVWKKKTATPNNMSPNKLTRIVEFVFVCARKSEVATFKSNKQVSSYRRNGQANYENIMNFVEARNNDGTNPYNKATFSSELIEKLIDIYYQEGDIVYDSFMGTGTTAIACANMGLNFIGSEISKNQVDYSYSRLSANVMGRENAVRRD